MGSSISTKRRLDATRITTNTNILPKAAKPQYTNISISDAQQQQSAERIKQEHKHVLDFMPVLSKYDKGSIKYNPQNPLLDVARHNIQQKPSQRNHGITTQSIHELITNHQSSHTEWNLDRLASHYKLDKKDLEVLLKHFNAISKHTKSGDIYWK